MILPTLITTLFLASALLTTAASAASLLTNKYDCQTPDNAPNVDEVRWTIDYLKGIGNRKCKQDNGLGSKCTKVRNSPPHEHWSDTDL